MTDAKTKRTKYMEVVFQTLTLQDADAILQTQRTPLFRKTH
jgi:hypothetical protein